MNQPAPADATDAELADFIGWHKAASAKALADEAPWIDEARRRRRKKYLGELFEVTVVRSTRLHLVKDAVVAHLGAAWVAKHSKPLKQVSVRATARQKPSA